MTNANKLFTTMLLKNVRGDLTKEQKQRLKGSWTYGYQRGAGEWEFQNPSDGFYWFGDADNAADARAQGTLAWLARYYPEQD